MDEEDEIALKLINGKLPTSRPPLNEDQFEQVMNFFEETVHAKQPFAAVDNPPVLPLEELEQNYDDTIPVYVRQYAQYVYDHWAARREARANHAIQPRLKFETGSENDDSDPYVCFRRREIRQVRRTRNRDNASQEKLKKLRHELEAARSMLVMVRQREQMRKELLEVDRAVFAQRQHFRETKRKLKIPGDDELLVNQKRQKLPPPVSAETITPQATARPGPELKTIDDIRSERQRNIDSEIQNNVERHIRWNEGYVDSTTRPITPLSPPVEKAFLPAVPVTEYLPTPPASASGDEASKPDVEMLDVSRSTTPFRYASPVDDDSGRMPSFRRRIGRGGRVLVDRRLPKALRKLRDAKFRFDNSDDDDDDEQEPEDPERCFHSEMARRTIERALLLTSSSRGADVQAQAVRRAHIEQATPAAVQARAGRG